jgi:hypothetical protein
LIGPVKLASLAAQVKQPCTKTAGMSQWRDLAIFIKSIFPLAAALM